MTPRESADFIITTLKEKGFDAFLVGGCVRDIVLGREPEDYDVTTSARPEQVMELFPKTVPVGKSFGVITVVEGENSIEVATFRSDGKYDDGRHPEIVFYADKAEDDVTRRDFTMNGLLCLGEADYDNYQASLAKATHRYTVQEGESPDHESHTYGIVDYVGGMEDIKNKTVRCIGDPEKRFREDALRMLRACRFAAQLGFTIYPTTMEAIRDNAALIGKVSAERITAELLKIVSSPYPTLGLMPIMLTGLIDHLPIAEAVKPGIIDTIRRFSRFQTCNPLLGMAMLFLKVEFPVTYVSDLCSHGLKMSRDDVKTIVGALEVNRQLIITGLHNLDTAKRSLLRLMRSPGAVAGVTLLEQTSEMYGGYLVGAKGPEKADRLIAYLRGLTYDDIHPERLVTGDDLVAMGMKPCKEFKSILETIEDMQLEGTLSDREHALEVAKTLVDYHKQKGQ